MHASDNLEDAQEEKYFGHPRIRLICLQTSPGSRKWEVDREAVNSTTEQLEYECTHIRDFDVLLVKATGGKCGTRYHRGRGRKGGRQKVKERSEEASRAEYRVDSNCTSTSFIRCVRYVSRTIYDMLSDILASVPPLLDSICVDTTQLIFFLSFWCLTHADNFSNKSRSKYTMIHVFVHMYFMCILWIFIHILYSFLIFFPYSSLSLNIGNKRMKKLQQKKQ